MNAYIGLPPERRRRFCEEAQAKLGLPAVSIEKDFWVCWTLRELFGLHEWGTRLTFKGGTSLSKAWKLVDRFSEDIDIVIDREFLGFGGGRGPEAAPSKKQTRQRLDDLKEVCQRRIREDMKPTLEAKCRSVLPAGDAWTLSIAPPEEDPDQQTLLFTYPTVFPGTAGYINPWVKIELGARSDTEPTETPSIRPYLHEALEQALGADTFTVRAVAPRRTFWEKAMLLHEETYRPDGKPRKARMARHYYDLWCLITKGVAKQATDDKGLFERIAAHRVVFFRYSWMDYSTLRQGTLRIVPTAEQRGFWEQDYKAMREDMFFGAVPTFDEIIRVVSGFEQTFNKCE